jgi:type IV secretory pathway TrbL component
LKAHAEESKAIALDFISQQASNLELFLLIMVFQAFELCFWSCIIAQILSSTFFQYYRSENAEVLSTALVLKAR